MELDDEQAVLAGERSVLDVTIRRSPAALERLLDPDFTEIDPAGARWDRAMVVQALQALDGASPQGPDDIHGFQSSLITADVALCQYTLPLGDQQLSCTSLWRRSEGTWRMRHHQQTAVSPPA